MKILKINTKQINILAFVGYTETKFVKENHGTKEDWLKIKMLFPKKATNKK